MRDRQTDRQTDSQTDRQTETEKDRQTETESRRMCVQSKMWLIKGKIDSNDDQTTTGTLTQTDARTAHAKDGDACDLCNNLLSTDKGVRLKLTGQKNKQDNHLPNRR